MTAEDLQTTAAPEPTNAPGRAEMPVEGRTGADAVSGSNEFISWGARSDVGLVRGHNEDSFLLRTPLFVVSDGMGGHAAGEVASSIAVETIGDRAPGTADDVLLGAAVEAANLAVIKGAEDGIGKPGMGCTATAVLIEKNRMAVAHVGDSRVYVLHHGTLVRITHDHSYVEELVDCGQITADEARTHPSRSIITRALGSDPEMYADHFSLEVNDGDRIILCSDGLSSMISDSEIEAVAVSSATPQQAADNLVAAALTAGGADNVTVVVVDVTNDGLADAARRRLLRRAASVTGVIAAVVAAVLLISVAFIRGEWYLGIDNGSVAIYRGIKGDVFGIPLNELVGTSAVSVTDLPASVQDQLEAGIRVQNEETALATIDSYHDQINEEQQKAAQIAQEVSSEGAAPAPGQETSEDPSQTDGGE
ncbi:MULTISPECIES: Stp1/IreP family PP2C-type Ser/Thr phosphatase [Atopobiaceae]|uniref:Stp1/IreP family PP2C-type Ser/Thr phosphatase n=1 Tax=Atopobiaceae TaxID=1643824 RepID=UPI001EF6F64E|nr:MULTISPECIES: Stp1/IreP family PP2C-type Ser/Thr phosphatase [Atopobiaceae]MCR8908160.1 Stp1/IreP family PP2C-type Ser/Thr phosphatase [Thermophilibacter sp. ET337]